MPRPLSLQPREDRLPVVPPVAPELKVRQPAGACLGPHPGNRHREQLGDLVRLKQSVSHVAL